MEDKREKKFCPNWFFCNRRPKESRVEFLVKTISPNLAKCAQQLRIGQDLDAKEWKCRFQGHSSDCSDPLLCTRLRAIFSYFSSLAVLSPGETMTLRDRLKACMPLSISAGLVIPTNCCLSSSYIIISPHVQTHHIGLFSNLSWSYQPTSASLPHTLSCHHMFKHDILE